MLLIPTPRKNNCDVALEPKELWMREGWSSNDFMLTREHFSLQYTFYLGRWVNAIQQKRTWSLLASLGLDLRQLHVLRKGRAILPCWKKKLYIYLFRENQVGHRKTHELLVWTGKCCFSLLLYIKDMEEIDILPKMKYLIPILGNIIMHG